MLGKSLAAPLVGVLVAAPAAAFAAASASPAPQSVEVTDEALVFRASPGVQNDIILSSNDVEGTSALTDTSGVPLTSTTCEVDGSNATCPSEGIRIFEIHLGDMDDNVYGGGPWYTPNGIFAVSGGSGDDSIEGNLTFYGDVLGGQQGRRPHQWSHRLRRHPRRPGQGSPRGWHEPRPDVGRLRT
jgi:hypothetical protein